MKNGQTSHNNAFKTQPTTTTNININKIGPRLKLIKWTQNHEAGKPKRKKINNSLVRKD